MSRGDHLIGALLLVLHGSAAAALELEGGVTHEELTNDRPDWDSVYVEGSHDFAPRQTLDLNKVVFNTEAHPLQKTW